MVAQGIEEIVHRVAESYDVEVYEVHESSDTLVIKQDQFDETRVTMTSALIFDRYDADFEHIEIRVPDSGEKTRISRHRFTETLHRLSNVVGDDSPGNPYC
jgi:hypothetical protein